VWARGLGCRTGDGLRSKLGERAPCITLRHAAAQEFRRDVIRGTKKSAKVSKK
jgi:hypothetical protein